MSLALTLLMTNTRAAPAAVTPHVKSVAPRACITGSEGSGISIILGPC